MGLAKIVPTCIVSIYNKFLSRWRPSAKIAQAFYVGRKLKKELKKELDLHRKVKLPLKDISFRKIKIHRAIGIKLLDQMVSSDQTVSYEIFDYQLVFRFSRLKTIAFIVDDVLSTFIKGTPGEVIRQKQAMNDSLMRSEKISELFSTEHGLSFEWLPDDSKPSPDIKHERKIGRHKYLPEKPDKPQHHRLERIMAFFWTCRNYDRLVQAGIIKP